MTDQAVAQSGGAITAVAEPQLNLTAMMKAALAGQVAPAEGQTIPLQEQEQSGASPEQSEATTEEQTVEKYRVPAFDGDGYEELTIDELKSRFLMQKDYTQKTQTLAEERRQIAELRTKAEQAATERISRLDHDLMAAASLIKSFEQNVDWDGLRQADPAEFLAQKEAQAQRVRAWKQAAQTAEALKAEQQKARRAVEAERLRESVPEWLDPVRATADAEKLVQGAAAYRLTPQEIDAFDDHRMILILRDAVAYRELKEKGAAVKAEIQKAPQLAKPGAGRPQGNAKALATHRDVQTARQEGTSESLRKALRNFL